MTSQLFDQGFPPGEQFPRQMRVVLEKSINPADVEPKSVLMTINGAQVGDPLRDNNYASDGYRFHDVFHIAHAAILGWSPVLRALMKRKRLSDPQTKWKEDGKKAIYTEEGIVAMLFSYAQRRNFLKGQTGIEPWTMSLIKDMTSKLEVSARSREDWQEAIFTGYSHWRNIQEWGEGRLQADLESRTIDLYLPKQTGDKGQVPDNRPG